MKALLKVDPKLSPKLHMRLHAVSKHDAAGPLQHSAWLEVHSARCAQLGGWPDELTWDQSFRIDWQVSGHFQLLPVLPTGTTDASAHVYTHLRFRGIDVPINSDHTFRGHHIIEFNWDHWEPYIVDPRVKVSRMPCWFLFAEARVKELAPAMEFKPLALEDDKKPALLQLEDGSQQAAQAATPSPKKSSSAGETPTSVSSGSDSAASAVKSFAQAHPSIGASPDAAEKGIVVVTVPGARKAPPPHASQKKQAAQQAVQDKKAL